MEVVEHRTAEVDATTPTFNRDPAPRANRRPLGGARTTCPEGMRNMYRVARLLWERNAWGWVKPRSSASPAPVWQPA